MIILLGRCFTLCHVETDPQKQYTLFVEKTGERCYYKDVDRTNAIHVNSIEFYSGSKYK